MTTHVDRALTALLALVERATWAPSPRNTQPWRWRLRGDGAELELATDVRRRLGVRDRDGRELVMSCGAALLTFRVAAAHAHLGTVVEVLPDPDRPELLARVQLCESAVDTGFGELDAVVAVRRAWHGPMPARPVPQPLRDRLAAEAHVEGARLLEVPDDRREDVVRLVAAADAERARDPRWRAEQARWVRSRWRRDGMPAPLAGVLPARLAVRHLDVSGVAAVVGRGVGQDAALVRAAPTVAVLATSADDRAGRFAAGQALQRVLLVAAAHGLVVGFADSVCEDPARRTELARALGTDLHPQALLRIGVASEPPPGRRTRRRRPADVVDGIGADVVDEAGDRSDPADLEGSEDALG